MLKLVNEYLANPSKARLDKIKRNVDKHPMSAMFLPSAVFIEIEAAKY